MELVPIIVKVLLIVAVLTALAIIFSYLAYKRIQKRGDEDIPIQKFAQPMIKAEKSVRHIVQRITKNVSSNKLNVNKPIAEAKIKNEFINKMQKEAPIKKPTKKKSINTPPKLKRVEVVQKLANDNSKQNNDKIASETKKDSDKKSENKKLKSLGDQILDKYAEDEDDEMYTMKTNKSKPDKK